MPTSVGCRFEIVYKILIDTETVGTPRPSSVAIFLASQPVQDPQSAPLATITLGFQSRISFTISLGRGMNDTTPLNILYCWPLKRFSKQTPSRGPRRRRYSPCRSSKGALFCCSYPYPRCRLNSLHVDPCKGIEHFQLARPLSCCRLGGGNLLSCFPPFGPRELSIFPMCRVSGI